MKLEQTYKCALPKCNRNITEEQMVRIGTTTVCFDHIRTDKDFWTEIKPTEAVMQQFVILLKENARLKMKTKEDYDIDNLRNKMLGEISGLNRQIQQLTNENSEIKRKWESDRNTLIEITKMRSLNSMEPIFKNLLERLYRFDGEMQDGREFLEESNAEHKKEIEALKNEIALFKSDVIAKNNESTDVILLGLDKIRTGNEQALDASQKAVISETIKINDALSALSTQSKAMLEEIKTVVQTNNVSGRVDVITEKLDSMAEDIAIIFARTGKTIEKSPEPAKVEEPKIKDEKVIEQADKPVNGIIPATIINPIQLAAYKIIQKSPCEIKDITGAIDGDKEKIRNALKILRKNGHIILTDKIYSLPT